MKSSFTEDQRDGIIKYTSDRRSRSLEIYELEVGDEETEILGLLGAGGTKEVYDVSIGGDRKALGIPNAIDNPQTTLKKWGLVLEESENTDYVRDIGMTVNDIFEVRNVDFGEYSVPGVVMKRYQDHEFQIYDAKNNQGKHDFLGSEMRPKDIAESLSSVAEDISVLIDNQIDLDRDSFNLYENEGSLGVYLNDLGTMQRIDRNISESAEKYADFAIGAFAKTARPQDLEGKDLGFLSGFRNNAEDELKDLLEQNI
jgi:hypothetical protein